MRYTKIRTEMVRNKKNYILKDENGRTVKMDSEAIRKADRAGHKFDGLWFSKSRHVLESRNKEIAVQSATVAKLSQKSSVVDRAREGGFRVLLGSEVESYANSMVNELKQERNYISPLVISVLKMPATKLHILFGLRSTGKTRGICHCIKGLISRGIPVNSIVFIDCMRAESSSLLEATIEGLRGQGVRFFFIDEASALNGIIDTLKSIADFQTESASIVLAGTDSYVFAEAITDRLYHRHITYLFSKMTLTEYLRLIDNSTVDSALKDCGVFDDEFLTAVKTMASLETSVVTNIYHSIEQNKDYFNKAKGSSLKHQDMCKLFALTNYELLYLLISVLIDSVHPKADGRLMDIKNMVNDPDLRRVFRNMTGERYDNTEDYKSFLVRVARTYKKNQIGTMRDCLRSLGILQGIHNVLLDVPGVDITGAEVEYVCLVQNLFYTLSTLYKGERDIGSLFENFILAQTVSILGTFGIRYDVGFARFRDSNTAQNPIREIDIVIKDRVSGKQYLIEIKSAKNADNTHITHLTSKAVSDLFPGAFKWVCYRGSDSSAHRGVKYINAVSFIKVLESGDLSKLEY